VSEKISRLIGKLFSILLFSVPLILFPTTSELFEFNKIVLVYILTVLIVGSWVLKMILQKKIVSRRTILDIPLLIFLGAQLLSTLVSIDVRTSLFGYYSRFHGGLLSNISYSLLYWAWVSNMDKEKNKKAIKALLASAIIVSIYGVLEHFGIDKDLWVQDVQNRVFSTLGQPNWLAAWIVAILPITWAFAANSKLKRQNLWLGISALFFLTLLYTKSRSGLLGFAVAYFVFWGLYFLPQIKKKALKKIIKHKIFLIHTSLFLLLAILAGTPWTPSINSIMSQESSIKKETTTQAPALETGGTESGEIRKIVWKGAVDMWKHYPLLGPGVETFAFVYYNFRPVEHNLVSEWNFIYNKAHNEYLNALATTGLVGFTSYLILISAIILQITKKSITPNNNRLALLAGFSSILITNFFGFSVVPVALLFFLYPAMAATLERKSGKAREYKEQSLPSSQKTAIVITCSFALLLFYSISKYWYADFLYAKGKNAIAAGNPARAREILIKTVKLSSKEAIYWNELSKATVDIAVDTPEFAAQAIKESEKATSLSPKNVNILRDQSIMYIKLSSLDLEYLLDALATLNKAIELAPTDAKFYYNLALTYVRMGQIQ